MPNESDAYALLCDAITKGSYPQSEELLTSDLSAELVPQLIIKIAETQRELKEEIKSTSKDGVGDVDEWISQAKQVQEDIARCREESKRIVEEHRRVQALREDAFDYQRKVELLNTEIEFTELLKNELDNANITAKALRGVEDCLLKDDPCAAATRIEELDNRTTDIPGSRTSTIIRDLRDEFRLKTRVRLEAKLTAQISIVREQQEARIDVRPDRLGSNAMHSDALVRALDQLGDFQDSVEPLMDKIKAFVLQPLRHSSRLKMTAYTVEENSISLELGRKTPTVELVLDFALDFIRFLHASFGSTLRAMAAKAVLADLMIVLVNDWLNPGLPTQLPMLDGLDELQNRVTRIQKELQRLQWDGHRQLQEWLEDIPRAWLNKRKAASLDAVRKAFTVSKGNLRQVERIERQSMARTTEDHGVVKKDADAWDAGWDEDAHDQLNTNEPPTTGDEEDANAWGFEEEEDEDTPADAPQDRTDIRRDDHAADDTGDAWGWDDDSPVRTRSEPANNQGQSHLDGFQPDSQDEQEVTLTEVYSISEIPDHIIEIIGKDISDAQTLSDTLHKGLDSSASRGLLALPTLALAMFRATAPSCYGASPALGDIHRYNDSLYIAERLRHLSVPAGMLLPHVDMDVKAMEKFARLAYSKEMETQRLIIWDLLEGAQGFTSCTQFPYSQEIENAVSSVVDHIRALHQHWKPVLSTSALMQSIGSLVTMVIAKVISSIEEMDDISEPESRRLTDYCQQIASLEVLFLSTAPPPPQRQSSSQHNHEHEAVPMSAVYVANWLKFQYLINILDSSLVDIKYLWTEGELSLEFRADEVVDLIRALFAESAHRRSAIAAIKGSRTSR
ncbi:hypothetical protein EDD37DRAFT_467144 [Exophiala viscosa]|uniref:ZW10 C-terminal helical domain-containing protein n=1 Tax=Exophiala viscosa TaxID=2486360 RepID=A0AAN6IEJ5_9EURO|nr:hypothetical protein EDD36DRAFT_218876 [Exophiala viscosa]KAI1622273.1 hypothetical protein EDD37DRAFT_467144 [Exophiala viscosa]